MCRGFSTILALVNRDATSSKYPSGHFHVVPGYIHKRHKNLTIKEEIKIKTVILLDNCNEIEVLVGCLIHLLQVFVQVHSFV